MSSPVYARGSRLVILANETGRPLAKEVAGHLDAELIEMELKKFPDGELHASIKKSIRGSDAFFFGPFYPDPTERWAEAIIALSTIKYSTPFRLIHVPTYLGFGRKDWKDEPRCPITIREVAQSTEPYIDRVLAIDMHTPQIQGIYRVPLDHLKALPVFLDYFKIMEKEYEYAPKDVVFVSPDLGNAKQTARYSELTYSGFSVIHKKRNSATDTVVVDIYGDSVEGKVVRMVDDMISTGGSVISAARYLKEFKPRRVEVYATHGLFVPIKDPEGKVITAEEALSDAARYKCIDRVFVTDTIPRSSEYKKINSDWLTYIGIGEFLSKAINYIHKDESISQLFPEGTPI